MGPGFTAVEGLGDPTAAVAVPLLAAAGGMLTFLAAAAAEALAFGAGTAAGGAASLAGSATGGAARPCGDGCPTPSTCQLAKVG